MRYDIIINLDYENYPHDQLKELFKQMQEMMLDKGFIIDGRRFTLDQPAETAQELARQVVDELEVRYQAQGKSIYPWIREFFGFEPENASNLLLPPTGEIEVQELADLEGASVDDLFNYTLR